MANPVTNGNDPSDTWPWRIIIDMNETLAVRVGSNLPSVDVTEMVLYRALMAIERELDARRLARDADRMPRVTSATHVPRGMA